MCSSTPGRHFSQQTDAIGDLIKTKGFAVVTKTMTTTRSEDADKDQRVKIRTLLPIAHMYVLGGWLWELTGGRPTETKY